MDSVAAPAADEAASAVEKGAVLLDAGKGVDTGGDKGAVGKGAATEVGAWSWPSEISETMLEGDCARVVVVRERRRRRVRRGGGYGSGILLVVLGLGWRWMWRWRGRWEGLR